MRETTGAASTMLQIELWYALRHGGGGAVEAAAAVKGGVSIVKANVSAENYVARGWFTSCADIRDWVREIGGGAGIAKDMSAVREECLSKERHECVALWKAPLGIVTSNPPLIPMHRILLDGVHRKKYCDPVRASKLVVSTPAMGLRTSYNGSPQNCGA